MTRLNGHQRLMRHRICLAIVAAGVIAGHGLSFVRPDLHPIAMLIGLASSMLWIADGWR